VTTGKPAPAPAPAPTWSGVIARRMARHALAAPATDLGPAGIAGVLCGARAQVLSAAELPIGRRIAGATRTDVQRVAALAERLATAATRRPPVAGRRRLPRPQTGAGPQTSARITQARGAGRGAAPGGARAKRGRGARRGYGPRPQAGAPGAMEPEPAA
jgi:hypothetical protein